MRSADLEPRCLVALLQGDAGDAALLRTLTGLLERTEPSVRIEVFAGLDAAGAGPGSVARVRWHPPAASVAQAARTLAGVEPGADLAIVAAGTVLPERWRRRLQHALHGDPACGSASPLRFGDPLYAPGPRAVENAWAADRLDRWLETRFGAAALQMPRPPAAGGLVRAQARDALAGSDDADWGRALSARGWVHVAAAGMFASIAGGRAAPPSPSTLVAVTGTVTRDHPLIAVRDALAAADAPQRDAAAPESSSPDFPSLHSARTAERTATPAAAKPAAAAPGSQPVQLHVAHSWGGGLGRWVEDFCDADGERRNLVLRSVGVPGAYGRRLCLQRNYADTDPLRVWDLSQPIHATAPRHLQYRAILREVIEDFGVQSVLVSSLIGHSLDVLATGLPTAIVTHDYYPLCVTIFGVFDTVCPGCSRERLVECVARNPLHAYFTGVDPVEFDALREAFVRSVLDGGVRLVAPSHSAALQWRRLAPALGHAECTVVPHGVALPAPVPFEPPAGGRLRLIVLNRLAPEKGGRLFAAMLPELARFADVTLLGCGDTGAQFASQPGVRIVDHYTRAELPALVARAAPHLGLQLSVFAETYCYGLTELWQMGVPVLACRAGSLAERIAEGVDGFLAEPQPGALLARLREIDRRRDDLAAIRATLLSRPVRNAREMVADYHRLLPADPLFVAPGASAGASPVASHIADGRVRIGALSVSAQATYSAALGAFARYTLSKLRHSPRLPGAVRRGVELLPNRWWNEDHRV